MKRKTHRAQNPPATPEHTPLDQSAVNSFHRAVEDGSHAAFEYVTRKNEGTGWFERGIIEEIVTQDGIDRITLRTLSGSGDRDDVEEVHYTIYLIEEGQDGPIDVYQRDVTRDRQPTLNNEYPAPGDRFTPDELPGCEHVGYLVGAGVLTEYRFHEPKPSEEFWSVPKEIDIYSTLDDSSELSIGVLNRTGTEQPATITVEFPSWVTWEHKFDEGTGTFIVEEPLENRRQHPVTLRMRHEPHNIPDDPEMEFTVRIDLGQYTETFTHDLRTHPY